MPGRQDGHKEGNGNEMGYERELDICITRVADQR